MAEMALHSLKAINGRDAMKSIQHIWKCKAISAILFSNYHICFYSWKMVMLMIFFLNQGKLFPEEKLVLEKSVEEKKQPYVLFYVSNFSFHPPEAPNMDRHKGKPAWESDLGQKEKQKPEVFFGKDLLPKLETENVIRKSFSDTDPAWSFLQKHFLLKKNFWRKALISACHVYCQYNAAILYSNSSEYVLQYFPCRYDAQIFYGLSRFQTF